MSAKLLMPEEFRDAVLERDGWRCVCCAEKADVSVHRLLDGGLWEDGGYYLDNGVTLCRVHHRQAELTVLAPEMLREEAGIKARLLPNQLDPLTAYDKWGNPYLNKNTRAQGELFFDAQVHRILEEGGVLADFVPYTKYPKTLHLPWSPGLQNDDRLLQSFSGLEGEEVVVTLKLDGENTTMMRDHLHARSLDSKNHPSRNWVKALHGKIKLEIPEDWRICGENLYAEHSIHYEALPSYFFVFNIWERARRLDWDTTAAYCRMLGLETVPILWRGVWDEARIRQITESLDPVTQEGAVIQVTRSISPGEWSRTSAKYVRRGHVQSDELWLLKPVVPNGLARTPEESSWLGRPLGVEARKPVGKVAQQATQ